MTLGVSVAVVGIRVVLARSMGYPGRRPFRQGGRCFIEELGVVTMSLVGGQAKLVTLPSR